MEPLTHTQPWIRSARLAQFLYSIGRRDINIAPPKVQQHCTGSTVEYAALPALRLHMSADYSVPQAVSRIGNTLFGASTRWEIAPLRLRSTSSCDERHVCILRFGKRRVLLNSGGAMLIQDARTAQLADRAFGLSILLSIGPQTTCAYLAVGVRLVQVVSKRGSGQNAVLSA